MRDGRSIKSRAVLFVILVVSLVAGDAIGASRPAFATTARRSSPLTRVERQLDSSGWRWREAGVKVYVVLHELAHGWQSTDANLKTVPPDMRRWGYSGLPAFEANADCIAAVWGAGRGRYWNCPPDAMVLAARRLANPGS